MPEEMSPPGLSELELIAARLLDLQSAWDDVNRQIAPAALELIAADLARLGAVVPQHSDQDLDGAERVDASGVVGATAYLIYLLTGVVAEESGVDRLTVINMTRKHLGAFRSTP